MAKKESHRNLAFEAQKEKNKPLADYVKVGREGSDDFKKEFELNWSYRNDLAKTIIALSAGMLALLVSLSASPLFKSIPSWMLLSNMFLLILAVFLSVASLWKIISVTHVGMDFMKMSTAFAKSYEQMIKQYGKFEPGKINDFFRIPFDRAWKNHNLAFWYLRIGMMFFVCSLLLLFFIGVKAMPSLNLSAPANLSNVNSLQSSGTITR
ncbi:MAG: hypothetical protein ACYC7L_04560 [Nitrospirota bacterium]